ncbi:Putative ribonuclease H protein At1g65750 [Linum perenne]
MALLAKQGWNLLTNPDALVSKVFKAKYFPRGDFLSAARGANPSVVWQSIWNRFVRTPKIPGLENLCVHDLFIPGLPQWDMELLEDLFGRRDVEAISSIPVRRLEGVDKIIWHLGKAGHYTVQSGYRWWLHNVSDIGTYQQAGAWSKLWAAKAPPKFKIMTWRLARNIVPTRSVLEQRHIDAPGECGICEQGVESNNHLFFDCDFTRECWAKAGLEQFIADLRTRSDSFLERLTRLLEHSDAGKIETAMAMLWSLWRERNARVWRNEKKPAFVVTRLAIEGLKDWKQAQQKKAPDPVAGNQVRCSKWHPPPRGRLKCNVDWAEFRGQRLSGIGASLRDSSGTLLQFMMKTSPGCPPSKDGESIAMFEALQWLRDLGVSNVSIETDSQLVANGINGEETDNTEFGETIDKCKQLLLPSFEVVFVRRDRNEIAHLLAKQSRYFASPTMGNASLVWMDEVLGVFCPNLSH